MASKRELTDRVQSLEDALEAARDVIDAVLQKDEEDLDFDPGNEDAERVAPPAGDEIAQRIALRSQETLALCVYRFNLRLRLAPA